MGLITRWLGIDQARAELLRERQDLQALMRDVLRVSAQQCETTAAMSRALESMQTMIVVEGPPEGRPGMDDETEAFNWEKMHES